MLALIENEDFVKLIVDSIACLVQRDNCRESKDVDHRSNCLDILEGSASVEASGGVIPTVDTSACSGAFKNRYAFPFAAGDAADESITNLGLRCVGNAERFEEELLVLLGVLLLGLDTGGQMAG